MCDDMQSDKRLQDAEFADLKAYVDQLQLDNDDMKTKLSKAKNTISDLQCRSMRDNLIFTGIEEPEYNPDESEDTEKSLCDFLRTEMKIFDQLQFHRVHRLGKYERLDDAPRPIIAKFERYKEREYVRSMAPKILTGKPFGGREQFPKVVEDRRKLLFPEMKRARANKNNKVRLVRDRLFINNFEYVPPEKPAGQQNEIRSDYQSRRNGTNPRWDSANYRSTGGYNRPPYDGKLRYNYGSRVFQRSNQRADNYQDRPQSQELDFTLPISNQYETLSREEDHDRFENRKHKASSPLDSDLTLKRHREHQGSDTETSLNASYIEMTEMNSSEQLDKQSHDSENNQSNSVAANESCDDQTVTEA